MKNQKAFTLAEVLITLGIIGIVAALTMPVLIQNHRKAETTAKLKKFYSTMAQAILLSEVDNGPAVEWEYIDETDENGEDIDRVENRQATLAYFHKYLANYIKYNDIVEASDLLEGEEDESRFFVLKLADSSYVYMGTGTCIDIRYDVNGPKGKNEFGKDRFVFLICGQKGEFLCGKDKAFCPYGYNRDNTRTKALASCKRDKELCGKLLQMDNWEFKDDYPYKL